MVYGYMFRNRRYYEVKGTLYKENIAYYWHYFLCLISNNSFVFWLVFTVGRIAVQLVDSLLVIRTGLTVEVMLMGGPGIITLGGKDASSRITF